MLQVQPHPGPGGGRVNVVNPCVENTHIICKLYGILPSNMDLYTSLDLVTRLVCSSLLSGWIAGALSAPHQKVVHDRRRRGGGGVGG